MTPIEFGVSRSKVKVTVIFNLRGDIHVSQKFLVLSCLFIVRNLLKNIFSFAFQADFILVVMSPKYRMEADSCEMENDADDSDSVDSDGENDLNNRPYRLHTKNIYRLMYREYIQSSQRCNRFVPLLFPGMVQDIIPNWMLDSYNNLFYYWPKQYKDLLWMLTKPENRVPEHVTPPVNRCLQNSDETGTNSSEKNLESE